MKILFFNMKSYVRLWLYVAGLKTWRARESDVLSKSFLLCYTVVVHDKTCAIAKLICLVKLLKLHQLYWRISSDLFTAYQNSFIVNQISFLKNVVDSQYLFEKRNEKSFFDAILFLLGYLTITKRF